MSIDYRIIFKFLGLIIMVVGICMLPPLIVALAYSEPEMVRIFLICIFSFVLVGGLLFFFIKGAEYEIRHRDVILTVALIWIITGILGAVPFTQVTGYANALFESISGFTTTGTTIFEDVESLPKSLLFWRSFTQWAGGLSIVVLVIAFLPTISFGSQIISETETFVAKTKDMTKYLCIIYIGFSLILFILFLFGGMNIFDSITHTFSTISSGGFSNYNDSIAHFGSEYISWVTIIFMIFAAINFSLYFWLFSKHWKVFFADSELKSFFLMICSAGICVVIANKFISGNITFTESIFEVVSIGSTTGFKITNYNLWPTFSQMMLFILLLIGGCTASTAGGLKVRRIMILLKLIRRNLKRRLHPTAVGEIKLEDKKLAADTITNVAGFIMLYVSFSVVSILILSLDGQSGIVSTYAVFSSLANVGQVESYAAFGALSKVFLSFIMIVGRLELYTVLLLFTPRFWNPDR